MKSPFKFLDAFTLKDKDAFFGRDPEIETSYTTVFKTPMLLVYGSSGTGKTSLIQCGLGNKFDGPDWYPIFIRRNDDLNVSITNLMRAKLGDQAKDVLADDVSLLLRKTLRPVYLIFDQFEELFIRGKEEEQLKFMTSLRGLLDAQLPCKIMLVMREEFIAQLYAYEGLIPELFDHRFRIEPMGPSKVKSVISSSFEKFNIHLSEPKEVLLETMVNNINDPKSGITLPYLQVYLDMLYRDVHLKQYGTAESEGYPSLNISKADIDRLGKIDNVLERFLDIQTKELQRELERKHKSVNPKFIQQVLNAFVTDEGTKRPVSYEQAGDEMVLSTEAANLLNGIPGPILQDILNALHGDRILRKDDKSMELAHDSLALVIHNRKSESDRLLQNIRKRLLNAFEEYQKTGAFLNQKQVAAFEEFRPQLGLTKELEDYLDKCEEEVIRSAQEEQDRLHQESRMAQQKQLARTRLVLLSIAIVFAVLAAFMAFLSNARKNEVEDVNAKLSIETEITKHQKDSIANIILQVDQQFSRMDSIISGDLPHSQLVKSLITLKSLVRNDTMDAAEMAEQFISVREIYTTNNQDGGPDKSSRDSVINSARVFLSLQLKTPRPKEFIQVKWLSFDGKVLGKPTYLEVESGSNQTKWVGLNTVIKQTGKFRAEVYNSQGIEVGRTSFRIAEAQLNEVSMTENSEFRTMKSGTLNNPGPSATLFKVGDKLYYYVRINSPKPEKIYVQLQDQQGKEVWKKEHTTEVNEDLGARVISWKGANVPGVYYIRLINSKGSELAGHTIQIK